MRCDGWTGLLRVRAGCSARRRGPAEGLLRWACGEQAWLRGAGPPPAERALRGAAPPPFSCGACGGRADHSGGRLAGVGRLAGAAAGRGSCAASAESAAVGATAGATAAHESIYGLCVGILSLSDSVIRCND